MNEAEAAAIVAVLVNGYPASKFTLENAAVYERGIADLDARETHDAVEELIRTSRFLPSVADIRGEVIRVRRARATAEHEHSLAPKFRLGDGNGGRIGPRPEAWASSLATMLEKGARYREMADSWYAARGKSPPADPAAEFMKICEDGAKGADVRERVKRAAGIADFPAEDPRYP